MRVAIERYLRDLDRMTKDGNQAEIEDYILSHSTNPVKHLAQAV